LASRRIAAVSSAIVIFSRRTEQLSPADHRSGQRCRASRARGAKLPACAVDELAVEHRRTSVAHGALVSLHFRRDLRSRFGRGELMPVRFDRLSTPAEGS
jgi:hypothetical protein